jgi:hypothetical protein
MATLILENNYLEFDGEIYWQKQRTAIGTKFAPANANIFMYVLEARMLKECKFKPWVWWRFLDDIVFIWLHGIERLEKFLKFINYFHKTISYTWDYSANQVSFLDVTICKEVGGGISTDVYSKPTDTHQYLDFRSFHPKHVKQAILYGLALRLSRICSSEGKFDPQIEEFKGYLHKRGFEKNTNIIAMRKG